MQGFKKIHSKLWEDLLHKLYTVKRDQRTDRQMDRQTDGQTGATPNAPLTIVMGHKKNKKFVFKSVKSANFLWKYETFLRRKISLSETPISL